MRRIEYAGDCPECGDELTIYRSSRGGRFIKCENPECDFSYPLPRSGKIEVTYATCPKTKLPIILITKSTSKHRYFWVNGPCFNCYEGARCKPMKELKEEYEMYDEMTT
ncbi:MAG: hypothetical protein GF364_14425 [Candidatus Lokiarchaeota archaeon]|nr:hypothetical protein [Candidatus Lokiarchaeota archaeon]